MKKNLLKMTVLVVLMMLAIGVKSFAQNVISFNPPALAEDTYSAKSNAPIEKSSKILILSENFDGTLWPPIGWYNNIGGGMYYWQVATSGTYPVCSPHSGTNMVFFNSYNIPTDSFASLITPVVNLSGNTGTFEVSFWMFHDLDFPTMLDRIEVFINTSSDLAGATLLGTANRPTGTGWLRHAFVIPASYNMATNYIIFKAVSDWGNNIFMDDVSIDFPFTNDVGVTAIIDPPPSMISGAVVPQITVKNFSNATQTNIPVHYKIGTGGAVVSATIGSLDPGASTNVSFPTWAASNGNHNFIFYTGFAGDAYSANDTMQRTVVVSNLSWTAGTSTPLPAYMGSATTFGGKFYALGGYQVLTYAATAEVNIYNVATDSWTSGPPLPAARYSGMAAATSTKVYYMGGADASYVIQNNVWELTPSGTNWVVKTPLPVNLGSARSVVYQDSLIYVLGGSTGSNSQSTVYLYNTVNDTWRTCTPMPAAAQSGAAGIVGNTLVWTSGNSSTMNATYEGVISATDHANITWTSGTDIPVAAQNTAGGSWGNDEIIVATGNDIPVGYWTPSNPNPCYAYNPATNVWRTLPYKTTPTISGYTASLLISSTPTTQTWKIVSVAGYKGGTSGSTITSNTEILTEVLDICTNPSTGGTIATDTGGCSPFDPPALYSTSAPAGHTGILEYKWQFSTTSSTAGFSDIPNSYMATYDPASITATTWYKRIAHVNCKSGWTGAVESNVIQITVTPVSVSDTTAFACNSFTWHGNTYNASGTDTRVLTNAAGCDSTVTLHLTINPVYAFTEDYSICKGDTYNWHGMAYTTANTYTKSYTSVNGCDSIYTLNLTVDSVDIGVTLSGITISADSTANTYQWLDCNNAFAIIPNEMSQSFTATANGSYAVLVTQGLCSDTSACVQVATVGMTTHQAERISIYPNPISDELFIEYKGNKEKTGFEIFNSLGQVVFNGFLLEKTVVQTGFFAPGVYLIRLEGGDVLEFKKVVKK